MGINNKLDKFKVKKIDSETMLRRKWYFTFYTYFGTKNGIFEQFSRFLAKKQVQIRFNHKNLACFNRTTFDSSMSVTKFRKHLKLH